MKTFNLKLTDEERLVLKDNLGGLVRVSGIMQRTVIGNEQLAAQLDRGDQVLAEILQKVNKL